MRVLITVVLFMWSASVHADVELNCQFDNIISGVKPVGPRATEVKEATLIFKFMVNRTGRVQDITLIDLQGDDRWIKTYVDYLKGRRYKETERPYEQVCKIEARFG